ncbi:MAG: efflux RND transporter periplasmic adaptor subunit [Pirellula sp.]|nr:efflux RND transporter periplasmic adaptor subunit [Pirellula sp.]
MRILSHGNFIIVLIALTGAGLGLWTRRSTPVVVDSDPKQNIPVSLVSVPANVAPYEADSMADSMHRTNRDGSFENAIAPTTRESSTTLSGTELNSQSIEMLPGIAHPLHVAEIAAAADGPLWKLFVAEGDSVDTDTVMGLIDNRVALASVHAAQSTADRQAMMEAAKAKVSLADQYLNRIQQAASKQAASGLEVDEARSRIAEAQATLKEGFEIQREAVARLEVEKAKLDTHEIRAPFQGIVIRIYPHLGETVSRGAPIVKIADITRLRADLYVPLSRVASIRVGELVVLQAEMPGTPQLEAKVVFVAPLIDAATQTIRVVVEIENLNKHLPAGFAVRLSTDQRT